jgi:CubicO group peptidase (beta-lactamase class C family)
LSALEDAVHTILNNARKKKIFPGAAVGICGTVSGRREEVILSSGYASLAPFMVSMNEDVFFDLASLSKPLATTLAVLCLLKEKKVSLDEPLSSLLRIQTDKEFTLENLLGHASGLPGHREYYKELVLYPHAARKNIMIEWILKEKLLFKPGSRTLYSDLGYILLGRIVEIQSRQTLDRFVADKVMKPLGLENTLFYIPLNYTSNQEPIKDRLFAATEKCPWRHKVLCGEVHDDNCYVLGGVGGHAGLFGNIKSVLRLTTYVLDMWKGDAVHPNINNNDLRRCMARQDIGSGNTLGLGFDTPSEKGSSGGRYLSAASAGHLGFTGTSFWIDREKDLAIVLLTNRVHPKLDNEGIKDFRPLFHDTIVKQYIQLRNGSF